MFTYGPALTRAEAVDMARADPVDGPENPPIWTGQRVPLNASELVAADDVLELLSVRAGDICGVAAEDWPTCTKKQEEELTAYLRGCIAVWLTRHSLWPTFFGVKDVQQWVDPAPVPAPAPEPVPQRAPDFPVDS